MNITGNNWGSYFNSLPTHLNVSLSNFDVELLIGILLGVKAKLTDKREQIDEIIEKLEAGQVAIDTSTLPSPYSPFDPNDPDDPLNWSTVLGSDNGITTSTAASTTVSTTMQQTAPTTWSYAAAEELARHLAAPMHPSTANQTTISTNLEELGE